MSPDDPAWLNAGAGSSKRPVITYQKRKRPAQNSSPTKSREQSLDNGEASSREALSEEEEKEPSRESKEACLNTDSSVPVQSDKPKVAKTRATSSQYFLDFGQSDFSCTTCAVCGLLYAKGQEQDQKVHERYHKSYMQGVSFKGWQKERVVTRFEPAETRIVAVFPEDPLQHRNKVKEAAAVMEKEMGLPADWLIHKECKAYLYVASKKVLGCVVVEPIDRAFRAIPRNGDFDASVDRTRGVKKVMMFGNIKFVRELHHKTKASNAAAADIDEAVECEKEPVSATLGIRGLWVTHSARRKGIATKLVDAVRKHHSYGSAVQKSQCAFSQPTGPGKAFASNYCGSSAFLIYDECSSS